MIKLAMRFLLSWAGVGLIAMFGLLLAAVGAAGLAKPEETAPTDVSLKTLDGKPAKEWVKVTDGVVYWPGMVSLVETRTSRRGGNTTQKEKFQYVPLLTPEMAEEWDEQLDLKGKDAKFDYARCKVLLVVRPGKTPADFPAEPGEKSDPSTFAPAHAPAGEVISSGQLDSTARKELGTACPGPDTNKVVLLEVGSRPPTHGAMGMMIVFGLILCVPLGLKAIFRDKMSGWLYPRRYDDDDRRREYDDRPRRRDEDDRDPPRRSYRRDDDADDRNRDDRDGDRPRRDRRED